MKNYKERIRNIREDKDIQQEIIAKLLDTTQSNYSKYERGERKLSIEDLIKLCIYYNLSADYILGFTDEAKPLPKR